MFYGLVKAIAWPFRVFYFRIEAEGVEHLPRAGPAIVVANHASYLDAGVLGSVLPRKVHFIVLSAMYRLWRIRWFYWGMDTIPVRPGRPDHAAIRKALRVLAEGKVLGIFPEGSRSLDGRLQPPLAGAAMIAVKSGAPIVPAAIRGAHEAFPPGSIWPRPRKVRVRFGPPFRGGAADGARVGRKALQQLGERMMREIAALMEPAEDGSAAQGVR